MADQLDLGKLTLHDSLHAPTQNGFGGPQRPAYIPPHMRQQRHGGPPGMDGPPPPMMNGQGMNGSAWVAPPA